MGTKIIVDGRRSGKTTRAIEESARTGRYIVVRNDAMKHSINVLADELGIRILNPITLDEWKRGVAVRVKLKGIIVDEGLIMLEELLGTSIHMITISEREEVYPIVYAEENEKMNRDAFDAARYALQARREENEKFTPAKAAFFIHENLGAFVHGSDEEDEAERKRIEEKTAHNIFLNSERDKWMRS